MKTKLSPKQIRLQKEKIKKKVNKRFYERNIEAMRWCNLQGLTIYVSAQANNTSFVKIFIQKGMSFKPLNNVLYNQNEAEDVKKYIYEIDLEYERLYIKMKDKI